MKINLFLGILLAGLMASACSGRPFDPSAAPVIPFTRTDVLDLSPFMEKMRIVFLETREQSIFSEADKMIIYEGQVYILDKTLKMALCFDTCGTFLYRIQRIGKGPWEYQELDAMWINPATDELWLQSYTPGKIMVYGTNGIPLREFPVEWSARDMARIGPNRIIGYNTTYAVHDREDLDIGLFLSDEKGRLKKFLLGIGDSSWYYAMNIRRYLAETTEGLLAINQSDTIYRISPEAIVTKDFVADFGRFSMPDEYRKLNYSPRNSKLMRESLYLQGKDQILGFGNIRMFKAYLGSTIYFALTDLTTREGYYSSRIQHASGPMPILLPECVTDRSELAGLLNVDILLALRQSLERVEETPESRDLFRQIRELCDRGIQNDRPILWIAPIKKQWIDSNSQTQ